MLINPVERYCINKGREEGMKEGMKEGREEGMKEGREEGKRDIAQKMVEKGFSVDQIMDLTGLSKNDVDAILSLK